ncbi:hypothetical protein [Candidatus Magnetobacterium casense]|uniref:Secreted protein n=1 Tax=Candidatus Magnetobacterium casense TaxID=1455061 RepID=A0ABS6RWS7_9BACT|nr:hypothetical protein [Candidatus Magnetobacterium casensis]MBV6341087.1 hypothetical protein [Candidatus Magnetobacterium casensis]
MKKIVFLLAVLLVPMLAFPGVNVVTLSSMQKQVRSYLATDADPYYPNDTLTNFINRACREVASYGVIVKLDTVTVASGTIKVALNDDCLDVQAALPCSASGQAKYDGILPLGRIEFKDWNRVAASTQETNTKYYTVQPSFISPLAAAGTGAAAANLWLCPEWNLGTDSIWVFYYAQAKELSATTDSTNIPYQYVPLVEFYATGLALASSKNFNEAAWWFAQYDRARQEKGLLKQLDFIVKPKVIE